MRLDGAVPRWTALLPVKGLDSAKSRIAGAPAGSELLALAFLRDTVAALHSSSAVVEIVVVTSDPDVVLEARRAGCRVVDDTGHPGINAAVSWAATQCPGAEAILVLVSDLPALDGSTIDRVLDLAARHHRSFLRDQPGTGTTMWCTTEPADVLTAFGTDSARGHAAAGAVDLSEVPGEHDLRRARQDVDTVDDLELARALGLGEATASLVH